MKLGSFSSSRFLGRLKRDELCRRSFLIMGLAPYGTLLRAVGGGAPAAPAAARCPEACNTVTGHQSGFRG